MPKIVVLFRDKNTGKWEKAIAKDKEEKEIIIALHEDENPLVKRYCIIRTGGKLFFDSLGEAEAASRAGDSVQVVAPPQSFSEKSEDVEFYYQFTGEEEGAPVGQQGFSKEEYDKLPVANEEDAVWTGITEEEDHDTIEISDGEGPDDGVSLGDGSKNQ